MGNFVCTKMAHMRKIHKISETVSKFKYKRVF